MIWVWTGKTGSSKTSQMVRQAYHDWLSGRDIYSNTVLFFEEFGAIRWWEKVWYQIKCEILHMSETVEKPKRGRIIYFETIDEILEARNGVILFDEGQVLFNARSWESLPKEFQYKLQQSRKHELDLYTTTQNMGTIDITYRRLVQCWIHCENLWQWGHGPRINFGWFKVHQKDIDMLYNSIDDLKTPDIAVRSYFIHRWTPRLYDTMYDIGFKRFKTLWITQINLDKTNQSLCWIIPKEMSLSDAQKQISLCKSLLGRKK